MGFLRVEGKFPEGCQPLQGLMRPGRSKFRHKNAKKNESFIRCGCGCCGWFANHIVMYVNVNAKLLGGWTNPSKTYYIVQLEIFPKVRGENKKHIWNHHLENTTHVSDHWLVNCNLTSTKVADLFSTKRVTRLWCMVGLFLGGVLCVFNANN